MFRRRDGSRLIWGHWQNLTQDEANERRPRGAREARRFPWNGRAWLYIGRTEWGVEWSLGGANFGAEVSIGGDDQDLMLSVRVPLFSVYLHFKALPWKWRVKLLPDGTFGREVGFRIYGGTLWVDLWNDPMGDHLPWHVNFVDLLFGRQTHTEQTLAEDRVTIPLPEGPYPGSVRIFESTWKRPRWFAHRMIRADVTPDTPIPIPGKGENSWDCGETATHSLTTPADTVRKAVVAMVESVLRHRQKYGTHLGGGTRWKPRSDWKRRIANGLAAAEAEAAAEGEDADPEVPAVDESEDDDPSQPDGEV